jgi:hypothetical protein
VIEPILIINLLERSYGVLKGQTDGLTHEDSLLQYPFPGNCMNWVIGHILASRSGVMVALGMPPLLTDEQRAPYMRGSAPITPENAAAALPFADMLRRLDESQAQIIAALKTKTFADMQLPSDRPPACMGDRLINFVWHEAYHAGNTEPLRQLAGKNDQVIK